MLLDTSGLLCYLHASESQHNQAVEILNESPAAITHSYILAELVALGLIRRFPRAPLLAFVIDLLDNPEIETIWVDERLHRDAMQLLLERPDKGYSLCDAVSFVLMKERRILEALTTDRHFEQEGFVRRLVS